MSTENGNSGKLPMEIAKENSLLDIQDINDWSSQRLSDLKSGHDQSAVPQKNIALLGLESPQSVELEEVRALEEMGNVNWVGILQEYRTVRVSDIARLEPEFILHSDYTKKTPRYSYSVNIPESKHPLGATQHPTTFSAKKRAKQYAAKKVIDWLISNNHMPAVGSVQSSRSSTFPINPIHINPATSQVPILCARLGFMCPQYVIEPVAPCSPIYNGYADFRNDPRIPGHIGHVYNIYGKKKAKTEIAELVVTFLEHRVRNIQSSSSFMEAFRQNN